MSTHSGYLSMRSSLSFNRSSPHGGNTKKFVHFAQPLSIMLDDTGPFPGYSIPNPTFAASSLSLISKIPLTDPGLDQVLKPINENMLDKTKRAFTRIIECKIIQNLELEDKFMKRRTEFANNSINTDEIYGFIALPYLDNSEEEELFKFGLKTGMGCLGDMGDTAQGIYLSRYSDVVTPSYSIIDVPMKILVCRVLLGKIKKIVPQPNQAGWKMSPDTNYNCHLAGYPPQNLNEQPPHIKYRFSQLYVYEFDRTGRTVIECPTAILPTAVVTLSISKPGPDMLNILPPSNQSSVVWNGTLQIQNQLIKHITLHSHQSCQNRPKGLDQFYVDTITNTSNVLNFVPLQNMITDDKMGLLLQEREIVVRHREKENCFVQYFFLKCEGSEPFDELCSLMRRESAVGVFSLTNGTQCIVIPNGGFSQRLGIVVYDFSVLHCLFFSDQPSDFGNVPHKIRELNYKVTDDQIVDLDTVEVKNQFDFYVNQPPPQLGEATSSANGRHQLEFNQSTGVNQTMQSPKIPPLIRPEDIEIDEPPKKIQKESPEPTKEVNDIMSRLNSKEHEAILRDPRMNNLKERDPSKFLEVIKDKVITVEKPYTSLPSLPITQKDNESSNENADGANLSIHDGFTDKIHNGNSSQVSSSLFPGSEDIDLRDQLEPCSSSPFDNAEQYDNSENEASPSRPSTLEKNMIVIVDPDLINHGGVKVAVMNEIFNSATLLNKRSTKKVIFMWHVCITSALEQQKHNFRNDTTSKINSERAKSFLHLVNTYRLAKLVEDIPRHLCDQQMKSAHKYLICSLTIKRRNADSRVVFLSTGLNANSESGKHFSDNNLELMEPQNLFEGYEIT